MASFKTDCEHVSVPFTVQPQVLTQKQRPCVIYQEITFAEPMMIEFITFRNFYCAFVTIDQFCCQNSIEPSNEKNKDSDNKKTDDCDSNSKSTSPAKSKTCDVKTQQGKWVTILEKYSLMKYPHSENDAQKFHIIHKSMFINRAINNSTQKSQSNVIATALRFYLIQPSPNWTSFGLRDLMCYTLKESLQQKQQILHKKDKNNKTATNQVSLNSENINSSNGINSDNLANKNQEKKKDQTSKYTIETAALLFRQFAQKTQNQD